METKSNLYNQLLGGLCLIECMITLLVAGLLLGTSGERRALIVFLALQILFTALALVTLALRRARWRWAVPMTLAANIVLLINFPFGTLVGLYGLTNPDELRLRSEPPSS